MLEFLAGLGTGTALFLLLSLALAARKDRREREKRRQFAEMQRAAWAVQDHVAYCTIAREGRNNTEQMRLDHLRFKKLDRDRAAAAYLEG